MMLTFVCSLVWKSRNNSLLLVLHIYLYNGFWNLPASSLIPRTIVKFKFLSFAIKLWIGHELLEKWLWWEFFYKIMVVKIHHMPILSVLLVLLLLLVKGSLIWFRLPNYCYPNCVTPGLMTNIILWDVPKYFLSSIISWADDVSMSIVFIFGIYFGL